MVESADPDHRLHAQISLLDLGVGIGIKVFRRVGNNKLAFYFHSAFLLFPHYIRSGDRMQRKLTTEQKAFKMF